MDQLLPYAYVQGHGVLVDPTRSPGILFCRQDEPDQFRVLAAVNEVIAQRPIHQVQVLSVDEWVSKLEYVYSAEGQGIGDLTDITIQEDFGGMIRSLPDSEDLLDDKSHAPIVRIVNTLLAEAVRAGASDIHIEAYERDSVMRFRVDGMLREVTRLPWRAHRALISRIKVMAEMDIAEQRLPQDGRLTTKLGSRVIDVRISTLPSAYGERCVMRLLEKTAAHFSLEQLTMPKATLRSYREQIHRSSGLVLVTGPTGSGKSTTLYASLRDLHVNVSNVMTVEDPIEYDLPGIAQTQVRSDIGLDFAGSLRSILRQDPDVIMVGEIRDAETARIALQASFTGHLVLATLHSSSAAGAISRLIDIGIDSYLLSTSLLGVLGQRLARRVCMSCQGSGCKACHASGYAGRVGLFEFLFVDETIRNLIHEGSTTERIESAAINAGMMTLKECGNLLLGQGLTTSAELQRVVS